MITLSTSSKIEILLFPVPLLTVIFLPFCTLITSSPLSELINTLSILLIILSIPVPPLTVTLLPPQRLMLLFPTPALTVISFPSQIFITSLPSSPLMTTLSPQLEMESSPIPPLAIAFLLWFSPLFIRLITSLPLSPLITALSPQLLMVSSPAPALIVTFLLVFWNDSPLLVPETMVLSLKIFISAIPLTP